jgi:hypothetical protein
MKCSQAKPFTITSTNAKMGGAAIPSYEKGGMVKKPSSVYTAEMGDPPPNPDQISSLPAGQRKAAEARMKLPQRKKK